MRGRLTFSVVLQLSKYGMSARPHGVTTQKTDIDIFTALKTSNFFIVTILTHDLMICQTSIMLG
jgi:hypothetical protein